MASPPYATSPAALSPSAMSPPYPAPAPPSNKRRSTNLDAPSVKRRKASLASTTSATNHPLRQTSFPPEGLSPYPRSPSVDATSHVSGSAVSGTASGAPTKKKRGRKSKKDKGAGDAQSQTPSQAGGKAPTTVSGQGGDKDGAGEDEDDDENGEMAVEQVGARTEEQKQEEIRLRAMLVEAFDSEQYSRYELWRAAKLSDSVVKRVVNATVSQSVPQNVSTAVKAVAKLFAGEIIEAARNVQGEWISAGEKQSDLPTPPPDTSASAAGVVLGGGGGSCEGETEESAKADKGGETAPEARRGPLRPDHLREAWRRYRISGESRGVGVQQLWHAQQGNGVERFSTRTGKRLFK